ncbi:MAG: tRNA-intron lyase [Nitrososphaerota archaeon]
MVRDTSNSSSISLWLEWRVVEDMAEPYSKMIEAEFSNGIVKTVSNDLSREYLRKGFGVEEGEFIVYSPIEALYLVEMKKMIVRDHENKELRFNDLLTIFSKINQNIWKEYIVYRDLRKRNYVVKDGFSSELRFRIFNRGEFSEKPAKYLLAIVYEGRNAPIRKIVEWLEICKNMKKELVLAVVDRRNEVVYYTVKMVDLKP